MSEAIDVTTAAERAAVEERDSVAARLADLREQYETAERMHRYHRDGREPDITTGDALTTLRLDEALALELRDSMGRTVIAAGTDEGGEVRYAVWEHSAISGRQSTTWQHRRDVASTLEGREPRVRLRSRTPLADVETPSEFQRRGNGEVYHGP